MSARISTPPSDNITDCDTEEKFYREGLANFTLKKFQEAGFNETFYNNLKEVSYDETTHVSFLTKAIMGKRTHHLGTSYQQLTISGLNATPVAECTYAFGVTNVKTFIVTASILEGAGVSAYLGVAASIMDKTYLTAAGSILTVESRHSAYLRAAQDQSPFPQAFDAPLDFDEVYTVVAPFITSCPESNGKLPVKAFPALALDTMATAKVTTNASISLMLKEPIMPSGLPCTWYAAWLSVTGPTFVEAMLEGNTKFMTTVPMGFHGQSYVMITKENGTVTDDSVVAGPAIVEVQGANGMA